MSVSVSVYAFRPGAPGVPQASATGVFVTSLVNVIRDAAGRLPIDVRLRELRAAGDGSDASAASAAARWFAGAAGRLLLDRSRYLVLIYPKVPVLAHTTRPALLAAANRVYQALALETRLTGQRIVVVVEDLPIEMAEGRARAGGPAADLDLGRVRTLERTLFRSAHRLVAPPGFVDPIVERHGVPRDRFRVFRRNIYRPRPAIGAERDAETDPTTVGVPAAETAQARGATAETPQEELDDFQAGAVNFFYSGTIDPSLAPNFREAVRALRSAPGARLHICGSGGEAVRKWLDELEVANARHYGLLEVDAHDRLARRCDVGLVLYPADNPYIQLTPTMKYSAYLANGLAILSTDLAAVRDNLRADGVGRAFPMPELTIELLRWASRPSLWADFKARAAALSDEIRSGTEMLGWIEEIARGR